MIGLELWKKHLAECQTQDPASWIPVADPPSNQTFMASPCRIEKKEDGDESSITAKARKQAAQTARKPTTTPSRTEDSYGNGDIRDGERKKSRHPRQLENQQQHQAGRKTATAMAAFETAKENEHAAQAIWKPATTQGRAEDGHGGGLYMVFLLLVGVSRDFISGHQCKEQFHRGDSRVNERASERASRVHDSKV
ncbi:putative urea active transporter 1 [Venturia inaequalis]|nr:putative urea active transporter 1 [Venturia inaequalis]